MRSISRFKNEIFPFFSKKDETDLGMLKQRIEAMSEDV